MNAAFLAFVAIWALLGYLSGSIPFGLLLTRFVGGRDLRTIGSGNIGATNVLRTGRKDLAAATLLLDAAKAAVPVLVAGRFGETYALAAAIGAFLGHVFPIWLGFAGGKGVATLIGCLFGLWWPAGLIFCAVWLGVAFFTRYSSASALAASLTAPLVLLSFGRRLEAAVCLALACILWFKHGPNIKRLLDGSETKIGRRA
jgi:acyl phosphate:glycerol-3-phosphate acyltransferase